MAPSEHLPSCTTDSVRALALPDNQHALSGSLDKTIKLFKVDDGAVMRTFTHHTDPVVLCLALLPDGLRFISSFATTPPASPTTASRRKNSLRQTPPFAPDRIVSPRPRA